MTEISLSMAAERIIEIETESPVPGGSVHLFDGLGDPHQAVWFQARTTTGTARLYNLSNVILDSNFQILLQAGRRIPESRYMTTPEEYQTVIEHPDRQVMLDGNERFVIASNRSSNNYYHWMVQTLPAIFWGARTSRTGRIGILSAPLSRWQEDSLRLLGLADMPRVAQDLGYQYAIPWAQFSDFVSGSLTYQVSRAVAATFRGIAMRVPRRPESDKAIYVARTDSPYRPLLNEAELIALLRKMGVRIVVPGEHDLVEQVHLFRGASVIIGPHGAGLSNIGFCQPGALVYEFLPRHFPNACFDFLSQSLGLCYHAAFCGDLVVGEPQQQGWLADLGMVRSHVSGLLG